MTPIPLWLWVLNQVTWFAAVCYASQVIRRQHKDYIALLRETGKI